MLNKAKHPVSGRETGHLIANAQNNTREILARGERPLRKYLIFDDYFCVGPCWPTPTKAGPARSRP